MQIMCLHYNKYLLLMSFFVFLFFMNAEIIFFQNSELLINVILFVLLVAISSFLQLSNFYNAYYYYSYVIKRDSVFNFSIILSLFKKYNLLNFRNRIYLIYILIGVTKLIISNLLHLIYIVYNMYVLYVNKFFETKLFVIFFSLIPFFVLNINYSSVLSVASLI